jgi:hypothetical protein
MPRAWQQVNGAGVEVPTQQLPPPLDHVSAGRIWATEAKQGWKAQGLEATKAPATGPPRDEAAAALVGAWRSPACRIQLLQADTFHANGVIQRRQPQLLMSIIVDVWNLYAKTRQHTIGHAIAVAIAHCPLQTHIAKY